jgi:death-on-curing protein
VHHYDYLSLDDALDLIRHLGLGPIRDAGLLASALHRPQATMFGDDLYPSFEEKAVALTDSIVRNHALVDGNKRLAWASLMTFCALNDRWIEADDDDAYDFVIGLATSQLSFSDATARLTSWV